MTLQEIATGVTKKFKVKKKVACPHCHGSGAEGSGATETCPTCHGNGFVVKTQQSIFGMMQTQAVCPTCGGEDGMVVTVTGKGHAARRNGVPGDIQVYIEEEPHKELLREDNNLIYNLLLDVPTAALGGDAEIPTIDGKVKIKIEPGTQPGKVVRLRSKGLPAVQGYGYGKSYFE